tara:strand:+ start:763 stop:1218 length:456 start_codon:yes stop_codon:yes gene_type:complete
MPHVTLRIKDNAMQVSSFTVTEKVAQTTQNAFRRAASMNVNKGTLDFISLVFDQDNPVGEETVCQPLSDTKTVSVVRPLKKSLTVRTARQRNGAFAALTAHMLENRHMLDRDSYKVSDHADELADRFLITDKTATQYVAKIRAAFRRGEIK